MVVKGKIGLISAIALLLLQWSCTREEIPGETIGDNNAPYYGGIQTVLVQNYVNRLYIDIIGREPLDSEMVSDVAYLREYELSFASRDSLITKLQTDLTFREGDSSYKAAYYNRLYELFKVRMIEGASNQDILREYNMIKGNLIRDSLAGDWQSLALNLERMRKLENVLDIEKDLMNGEIEVDEAFARLLDNKVYDIINMNTFNFLNAAFDDLFTRFPTQTEFDNGYEIVEFNRPGIIFGAYASNKHEFIQILVKSEEFYEGMIRWTYGTLLSREPNTYEVDKAMKTFYYDHDLADLQKTILVTDEYANFE